MAGTYSGKNVVYVATAASVGADVVVLSGAGHSVKVTNVSGSAPLFWTVSHPGGTCAIPSTSGSVEACYVTAGGAGISTNARVAGEYGAVVQVVSTGTPSYTVEVQSAHATS